ncbi:P-loop containing nucleoside triphosphate hydrolase protein [Xylariales sp. PMI_506]|nr:P-loop containing nucleoside triphosphate hydrolase protein [Xylariales sp. PMI_506]
MSGKHVARKLSNRFSHIFSASSSQGYLGAPSVGSTASPPGTPTKPPASQRMRFAVVGDDNSGKTCMLLRFYRNSFCEDWNPTQYELFNKTILVDGQHVEVELWDMAGKIELHQLSLLSYLAWDAIFLCFSVNCERKFANAQTHWMDEIRKTCGDIPVVVVGTKIDTRIGSGSWAPLFPNMNTRISASEGAMAANGVGAIRYLECSAKTGHGVSHVFEEGVRSVRAFEAGPEASIREKNHGPGIGQLLCV